MNSTHKTLRPLVIDYDYLIVNSATGQIARTFWMYNNCKGFNPTIICATPIQRAVSQNVRTIEISDNSIIRHTFGLIREFGFPDLCHCPDQKRFSWMPFVLRYFRHHLNREGFDYIHSISCPDTSHLIALKIKQNTGLPWIAQFNDPWIGNEAQYYKTKFISLQNEKLEKLVAENSDLIIHSNRIIFEDWIERYGNVVKDKMVIFPFSFNMPNLPIIANEKKTTNRLRIYHIGSLYGKRSAKTFFKALKDFQIRHKDEADLVEVNFIGGVPESEINFANSLGLQSCVKFLGTMPPEDLEQYYRQADLFLVIDMNVNRSPSYPSKLLLYHYYRKPIMSITTEGSIIMDDMADSGHNAFIYDDISGMSRFLHKAVIDYTSIVNFNHDHWRLFTVENVTTMYKEQLKNLALL